MQRDLAVGALRERLTPEESISRHTGPIGVRLHDSALRLRVFFERERTHQYRSRFPGESVELGKKRLRGVLPQVAVRSAGAIFSSTVS